MSDSDKAVKDTCVCETYFRLQVFFYRDGIGRVQPF